MSRCWSTPWYAGNDGRDAGRIAAAAKAAGIRRIDYLLITHFHANHMGGAPEVSRLLPVDTFIDHEAPPPTDDPRVIEPFKAYAAIRAKGRHLVAKPGDPIPLKGLDALFAVLKVGASEDGAFTVTNGRTGQSVAYLLAPPW